MVIMVQILLEISLFFKWEHFKCVALILSYYILKKMLGYESYMINI